MTRLVRISTIALMAGLLATMPVGAQSVTIGGDSGVNIGGGGSNSTTTDTTVTVDTGAGNSNGSVSVDLNDLLGNTDSDNDGSVDLLGNEAATVDLDLFGSGDTGNVTLLDGGIELTLNLFGDSGTGGTGSGGTGGNGGNGGSGGSGGGSQTASLSRANARCVTPNADQIATLARRHDYTSSTFSSWAGAQQLTIVKINVCPDAVNQLQAMLAANANVGRLQTYLNSNATLRGGLRSQGYSTADVVATDRNGSRLIVYVL